jgi:hypothetical protein
LKTRIAVPVSGTTSPVDLIPQAKLSPGQRLIALLIGTSILGVLVYVRVTTPNPWGAKAVSSDIVLVLIMVFTYLKIMARRRQRNEPPG